MARGGDHKHACSIKIVMSQPASRQIWALSLSTYNNRHQLLEFRTQFIPLKPETAQSKNKRRWREFIVNAKHSRNRWKSVAARHPWRTENFSAGACTLRGPRTLSVPWTSLGSFQLSSSFSSFSSSQAPGCQIMERTALMANSLCPLHWQRQQHVVQAPHMGAPFRPLPQRTLAHARKRRRRPRKRVGMRRGLVPSVLLWAMTVETRARSFPPPQGTAFVPCCPCASLSGTPDRPRPCPATIPRCWSVPEALQLVFR